VIILPGLPTLIDSTAGVVLHLFSVPRAKAKVLPLNAGLGGWRNPRPFPHLPACTAFTIRAWSRRTVRCTAYQLMVCQATVEWESAPVRVATAVICLLSCGGYPNSLVMKDQRDVSPLSREVMLRWAQPLSTPLQDGLRFFPPPMPARLWAHLAARFPSRETYGVAMFHLSNSR